ncbi:hypothetical protein Jab_1c22050 [Janthinobacterium sp. HH01]|uniref:DUF1801 domain-containing protein n=1 Tax=Janthinobacterium sp. HH01 TaxID=1198452 RepID=UPI0002AE9F46|nr:DUF1801 domain-containing protein [Janthinobacterium sp. HH01]ELX13569.1 hypothetical protein Jab_1c22050 [Janthinobacterium sp. HH01]
MAGNKTKASDASVDDYLAAIGDEGRRGDCEALARLMAEASGEPPVMWGTGIVGFGTYRYRYDSGREGDSCIVGFSSRKAEISLYLSADFPERAALLARLGKYKTAKSCLYIRKLADVDLKVLAELIAAAAAARKCRHDGC